MKGQPNTAAAALKLVIPCLRTALFDRLLIYCKVAVGRLLNRSDFIPRRVGVDLRSEPRPT